MNAEHVLPSDLGYSTGPTSPPTSVLRVRLASGEIQEIAFDTSIEANQHELRTWERMLESHGYAPDFSGVWTRPGDYPSL